MGSERIDNSFQKAENEEAQTIETRLSVLLEKNRTEKVKEDDINDDTTYDEINIVSFRRSFHRLKANYLSKDKKS